MVDKKVVAKMLNEIGTLLELKGENPFKCRAYHNAALNIDALTDDLEGLIKSGQLKDVRGIGEAIASKISEFVSTGRMMYHEELKASLPPGVPDMLRIQGLGPKRVKLLYEKLGIESLEELEASAKQERLRDLAGFGQKTEENILKGIEALRTVSDKHLYPKAKEASNILKDYLRKLPEVIEIDIAGSLRRRKEIIGDIDFVATAKSKDRPKIVKKFVSHPQVVRIIAQGDTKASVVLKEGATCEIRIVEPSEFPFVLNYSTGSKEHNVEMRSRARKLGWSLNEYEFSVIEGEKAKKPPRCQSEADIYRALGLSYIEPELREDKGEFEAAVQKKLPKLIDTKDLQGTFHCHSTYSDGINTLEEMAKAAQKLGWRYLGIADHSKVAVYAGGLSEEKIREQLKEIDQLNTMFKNFRIFKGTEVDILLDGSLDYSDKVLSRFEFVVASIHSSMKMTEAEATKRITRALKNKYVTMLGHPTGRLLLSRDGYPLNMTQVIDVAADHGKAIEI
ncbi:MAG: DNA polymerase/3'-5' exonuclease PolX, partial [Bacteroidota bacterium]